MTEKQATPQSGYWYRQWIGSCPMCGATKSHKERVYDRPRPANDEDRITWLPDTQTYDYCDAL